MFQSGALFGSMTVGENVALAPGSGPTCRPTPSRHRARQAPAGRASRASRTSSPAELSGGMKKRAAIARAMALEPELLFLDEPSAGLDPVSAVELDELILTLSQGLGLTVVLVTHELDSIFTIAKRASCSTGEQEHHRRGDPRELRDTASDPRVPHLSTASAPDGDDSLCPPPPTTGSSGSSSCAGSSSRWRARLLGARSLRKDVVRYKSYFDESVQGLEVGSPVKFRGVTIGTVRRSTSRRTARHVEVTSELGVDELNVMGLGSGKGKHLAITIPPDLRVQLASAGITGVKFVQLDFFPIKANPPPDLPFPVPENYIPAAVSTMKNLEDAVIHAVDRFPDMTDAAMKLMDKVDHLMNEIEEKHLPTHVASTLTKTDSALAAVQTSFMRLDTGKISVQAQATLAELDGTAVRMNHILDRLDGDNGVVMSAQRASDAVGDAAQSARGLGEDVSATLRDVQLVTESLLKLTDALERDSDMLVKGRAKGAP